MSPARHSAMSMGMRNRVLPPSATAPTLTLRVCGNVGTQTGGAASRQVGRRVRALHKLRRSTLDYSQIS